MLVNSLSGAWQFRQAGTEEWFSASVPGGVHTDLLALRRIPDPFVADNEKRVGWVGLADWEYRHIFNLPTDFKKKEQVLLVCDGLDTLASVTLNGQLVGNAANMFRQYRWDVSSLLQEGQNELLICFNSVVEYITARQAIRPLAGVSQAIPGGPYVRKAPCQFGWDWGPQLPPVGIWKDIRLEAFNCARLADVHLRQFHSHDHVKLEAHLAIEGSGSLLSASLQVIGPDQQEYLVSQELIGNRCILSIEIDNPYLWWPNGLGEQPLYRVKGSLCQAGSIIDCKEYQVGLRTIELLQQPDEWGRSFIFVVNGQPFFAKGSNWIPADSFPTRISDSVLEGLLRSAAEAHQNMLRVWGGGFYEEERFYDLCDRLGLLVWQDFIFSCSIYPLDDPEFVENVHAEVVDNIRRLRHRASLALWCGNNEMEQGWVEWGWQYLEWRDLKGPYAEFFHQTLPAWCIAEDPDHVYWPSSPSSGTPFTNPNSQSQGDAHYWDVWHRHQPFRAYRQQFPRFMSEFGFQALPPLATIRTFAEVADWNMTSFVMEQHQKNASGNSLIVSQMLETFRLPKDFDSLVYLSMLLQAEGIRYGVEHWRRYTDRVGGTLYWQLNDCWPVASWSSLDYFGRWKALHYTARRFYTPLLLSIEDAPPCQSVFISSDLRENWQGYLRWALTDLCGEMIDAGEQDVLAQPFSVTHLCQLNFLSYLNDDTCRNLVFIAELWHDHQRQAMQTAFFAPTKHLELTNPLIKAQSRLIDCQLVIELTSRSLARLVECSLEGMDVIFSDNYFDLPAGRPVTITAPLPAGWDLNQAREALRVRSVWDTF